MSDFSCYVQITNASKHDLTLSVNASEGSWQGDIPQSVAANTTLEYIQLEDASGPHGSTGSLTLSIPGTDTSMGANFEDAYIGENSASIGSEGLSPTMAWSFEGASGSPGDFEPDGVPGSGHPVYLNFTFSDDAPQAISAS